MTDSGQTGLAAQLDQPIEDPSQYTPEVLQQMRKLGLPKPAVVSAEDWEKAAPALSNHPASVARRRVADMLDDEAATAAGNKSVLAPIYPAAVTAILDILEDPMSSEKTKASLAMFIIDHHVGKATQSIEHRGNFQLEFRQAAREFEAKLAQYRDVTNPPQVDNVTEAVDSFLEHKVGSDFSVGQRGSGEEPDGEEPEQTAEQGMDEGAGTGE